MCAANCQPTIRPGGPPRLAATLGAVQAILAHQAFDTAAADPLPGTEQRLPHPA
jgi:hypothetical protein